MKRRAKHAHASKQSQSWKRPQTHSLLPLPKPRPHANSFPVRPGGGGWSSEGSAGRVGDGRAGHACAPA
eukprot:360762-Chlamydomonas_euryale.AAC.17